MTPRHDRRLSPRRRDGALARLGAWRTSVAAASAVAVVVLGAVAAATVPGHADGVAPVSDPSVAQQPPPQQPQPADVGALRPPPGDPGAGFGGGGHAVSGGS